MDRPKTRITLETYGERHTYESMYDDLNANEMKKAFSHLMVCAGYPPSVIDVEEGEGSYEYVAPDEEVVKRKES